jgi:hypothetical protein
MKAQIQELIERYEKEIFLEPETGEEINSNIIYQKIISDLKALQEKDEWISVKDRLPENKDYVSVFIPQYLNTSIAWCNEIGTWEKLSNHVMGEISHWQPLPSIPNNK